MANKQYALLALSKVSVTSTSATLATLLGAALSSDLARLTLVPDNSTIRWELNGAADGDSPHMPSGGATFDSTKGNADLLQFYAASTIGMTVIQEG